MSCYGTLYIWAAPNQLSVNVNMNHVVDMPVSRIRSQFTVDSQGGSRHTTTLTDMK